MAPIPTIFSIVLVRTPRPCCRRRSSRKEEHLHRSAFFLVVGDNCITNSTRNKTKRETRPRPRRLLQRRRRRGGGKPSMQCQNVSSRKQLLLTVVTILPRMPSLAMKALQMLMMLLLIATISVYFNSNGSQSHHERQHQTSLPLFSQAFITIPCHRKPPQAQGQAQRPRPQFMAWRRWFVDSRRSHNRIGSRPGRPATATAKSIFQQYYSYNDSLAGNDNDDDGNKNEVPSSSSSSSRKPPPSSSPGRRQEIPILGPLIFRSKPLLVGESMILKPPITPLQWYTIQECVHAQHDALLEVAASAEAASASSSSSSSSSYVTIDEAPIVAVFHQGSTEYATLAAIVGISSSDSGNSNNDIKKSPTTYGGAFDDLGGDGDVDDDDEDDDYDFQTKISRLALEYMNTRYYNDKSQVRLVGIGRVKLSYITTKNLQVHPTGKYTDIDTDEDDVDDNDTDDNFDDDNYDRQEPIVVAQKVELLWDDSTRDGEMSKASSPVHSISKLGSQVSRIRFLHKQRQSLTKQLVMAQTRLDMASQSWEDHDGIGSISSSSGSFQFQDTISSSSSSSDSSFEESTTQATVSSEVPLSSKISSTYHKNVSLTTTLPSSTALRCLTELENYGLGCTQSAVVDLDAMTEVLISDILRPYFSPNILKTEEFYYEAFSWVALSSVSLYCTKVELEDAMFRTTRTSERLDLIYQAQIRHKQDLTELAQRKEQELLDCGEECTDIF